MTEKASCQKPVIFHWLWEGRHGGAERIVAKAFLDYTDGPFEHRVIIGKSFGKLIGKGERQYCLDMSHGSDVIHLQKIIGIMGLADKKILCLHQINPFLLAFAPKRIPTIYVEHGQSRMWKGGVREILWRIAWQSANRHIAGIVGVSNFAKKIFLERNPTCKKPVDVIYNPLLIEQGTPRTGFPMRLRVGFCGRLSREKGVFDIIECARLLKDKMDAEFVLIGDGPLREELEHSAIEAKLPVCFTGAVSNVREHLKDIDVILAPSSEETFNLAVLEAMAMGVVPIVYPTGGLTEIVLKNENGIVTDEKTPAALAKALQSINSYPAGYVRMSNAAFTRATTEFSLEVYRKKWDWIFGQMA